MTTENRFNLIDEPWLPVVDVGPVSLRQLFSHPEYRALGGNEAWRRTWFRRVTVIFIGDTLRQTLSNLRRDGTLWQWRTWSSAARFLFGKQGLVRETFGPWRDYLRADFHPSQHDAQSSLDWLQANRERYQPVGG